MLASLSQLAVSFVLPILRWLRAHLQCGFLDVVMPDQTLFFRKQDTGKWLVYDATNADVNAPVGKVRLTFMNGDTVLSSDFVKTDATELDTPLVSAPEGKVFSGWYRIDEYENGTTYTMVFNPDGSGHVTIPAGTTLEPMTLYALYEDASTAAATEGA